MSHSLVFYFTFISALITSPLTLCHGLMRKLNSETDPVALTCRKTTDFGFCVYTLRSDPRSKGAGPEVYAQISLDKLQAHVKGTSSYLQGLQKSATDPKAKEVVSGCVRVYGVADSKDVPSALGALKSKDYGNAIKAISNAMKDGEGCQDGVKNDPSHNWQGLVGKNKYLHDLSQLGIDLIGLIGK